MIMLLWFKVVLLVEAGVEWSRVRVYSWRSALFVAARVETLMSTVSCVSFNADNDTRRLDVAIGTYRAISPAHHGLSVIK